MNKAGGDDGIPVELFKTLKDDAVKVLHLIASKFGKLGSGHRTGKGQFSFQFQRKTMPKNVQTTAQSQSFYMLVFKLVLEKAKEPEIKLPTSAGSWIKQESSRKKHLFLLY